MDASLTDKELFSHLLVKSQAGEPVDGALVNRLRDLAGITNGLPCKPGWIGPISHDLIRRFVIEAIERQVVLQQTAAHCASLGQANQYFS